MELWFYNVLLQIKEGWGERYQQWMVETEKKIEELQEANTIL